MDLENKISPKQASEITGISYLTIIRAINANKLPALKILKNYLIDKKDLKIWFDQKIEPQKLKIEKFNNFLESEKI
jgi:excisionase family DNA binding protein